MGKIKTVLMLFLSFFKIGLFTFGGGYAMIAVIERELVEKKKWIEKQEYLDVVAIAESSPGPIAINSATYIGYKVGGILGAVFSTFGVVLPSFIIIFTISFFFDKFLSLTWVKYAFRGIQASVAFLIVSAGVKMLKSLKGKAFNIVLTVLSTVALITLDIFAVDFSSVFFILIGGVVGLTAYLITRVKNKSGGEE